MLTLLGSLLGFFSSSIPELLKLWQDTKDRRHELLILKLQLEQQRLGHRQKLDEIAVEADLKESLALYRHDERASGIPWVEGLRASVRPILTYAFFLLFAGVKGSAVFVLTVEQGMALVEALPQVWDAETQALFAATMSYWFGARSLSKMRG